MRRLAQLLTATALTGMALLAWQGEYGPPLSPPVLLPLMTALGQLAWLVGRTWLSRGLLGVTLVALLALAASYFIPEGWVGLARWDHWLERWPDTTPLAIQRPPLLWLSALVLLATNVVLKLRLGLGAPVLLAMSAILLGIQSLPDWHVPVAQSYVAEPAQRLILWLLALAQFVALLVPLRQHGLRVAVPLTVGGSVALAATLLWQQQHLQADRHLYGVSDQQGVRLATRLNREIGDQLNAMRRFVSFWELFDRPPSEAQWHRQVAQYQRDYRYFQDIGFITPDGVIRWVHPPEENQALVGTRLFETQPGGQAALRQALVERREGLAGVVELLQGGQGMIYYLPIVTDDDDRLLGAASMVISLEMLIEVMLEQVDIDHIAVSLADDEQLLARAGPFTNLADWSHQYAIDVGVQTLTLITRPSRAFLLQSRARLPELTLAAGLMLAYLLYQLLYAQRRLGLQNRATQQANADLVAEVETRTRLQQEVEWMARHDELTALPNRRHFMEYVKQHQARLPLTVMICDIDHFKRVNDRLGHLVGDRYLKAFSDRGRPVIEAADGLFARYGGEEFVACLPACTTQRGDALASALRQAMAEADLRHEDGQRVTLSIGVASVECAPLEIASLMQRADEALYRAKNTGRNRVVVAATG